MRQRDGWEECSSKSLLVKSQILLHGASCTMNLRNVNPVDLKTLFHVLTILSNST